MFGRADGSGYFKGVLLYPAKVLAKKILGSLPQYLTYYVRPRYARAVRTQSDELAKSFPNFGLVVQGPIKKLDDFTFETIKLYKKHFLHSVIILSTWEDEKEGDIKRFRNEGVEVILNRKPSNPGVWNRNLQIVSSYAGMQRAKELGAEYALKTRTDQRIYAPNIEQFLYNVVKTFPVAAGYAQKQRIVGVSKHTSKYVPYALSDMTLFGHIDDMLLFWSVQLDERTAPIHDGQPSISLSANWPEVYITSAFLTKLGRQLQWTNEHSWQMYSEHFCVVDEESLDIYWFKEGIGYLERTYSSYEYKGGPPRLVFREWLNLYHNY